MEGWPNLPSIWHKFVEICEEAARDVQHRPVHEKIHK